MSFAQTAALGALAGFTIYLGLPAGRLQLLRRRGRVALAMFAVGVLSFIFMDVLSSGVSIVDHTLNQVRHRHQSVAYLVWLVALLGAGFTAGSAGLAVVERRMRPLGGTPPIAGGAGAAAVARGEAEAVADALDAARRRALRTGLTIAAAIGVHNFAEGLAIGVSARAGAISLATVLIIGFALHNCTEGFGIVGPLGDVTPSWRWLGLAGLVGGGPTFLGSIVGYTVTSNPLELVLLMLTAGFMIGVITDLVVSAGGG